MTHRLIRYLNIIPALALLATQIITILVPNLALADTPSWLSSTSPTLQILSSAVHNEWPLPETSLDPALNEDCTTQSYKTTSADSSMASSCLVGATYGSLGSGKLLLNGANIIGTINPFSGSGDVEAMPGSNDAVVFQGASIGSYANIYTSLYTEINKTIASNGSVTYSFKGFPDTFIKDGAGNRLSLNTSTLGYSNNGRYMIVDVPGKSFVRIDLQTMQIVPFATSLTAAGSSSLPTAHTAISDDGNYAAISYQSGSGWKLAVYDLTTCSTTIPATLSGPVTCSSKDETSFLTSSFTSFNLTTRLRFDSDTNLDMYVEYNYSSGNYDMAKYRMVEPNASSTGSGYLAMGDSYASGEGAYEYLRGTDESGYNLCHNSAQAYPAQMASELSIANFHSVACSGATTSYVESYAQHSTAPPDNNSGDWLPGLSPQVNRVDIMNPSIITLSDGGNDIGFSNIIKRCTLESDDCYSSYQSRYELATLIDNQFQNWAKLYLKVKSDAPQNAKIYVTGYPQIVSTTGSCADNVRLSSSERVFAQELVSYLDYVIQQAASYAGVQYVDTQSALNGHRLCETNSSDVAVNGYTFGNDAPINGYGPIGDESFHPNFIGQQLLRQTVLSATSDLTQAMPTANISITSPTTNDTDSQLTSLLNATSDGSTIAELLPDPNGDSSFMTYLGSTWNEVINGVTDALIPSSSYTVTLNSTPTNLGSFTTDSSGNLTINATIPSTVTPGFHQVNITGTNMAGQSIDIQRMLYVGSSASDYDGDGIANSSDSCPYTSNSGDDTDGNGVDDSCQAYVDIVPLYRAVNGDSSQGQDPNSIYIERNESETNTLGISDSNPSNSDWLVVGKTESTDDATSTIANFTITDTGVSAANSYSRYVPYLSTRTVDNGCVELTPSSLAPLNEGSTTAMTLVSTNSSTCRSQSPTADVDGNSKPDNQDVLYRARNGSASGEDSSALYVERNTNTAEAILGISDYSSASTGWALLGNSEGTATGTFEKLYIIDPTTGAVVSSDGIIPTATWDRMPPSQITGLVPLVLYEDNGICKALEPSSTGLVTNASSTAVNLVAVPSGLSCSP